MIMYCCGVRFGSKSRFTAESIEEERSPPLHAPQLIKTPNNSDPAAQRATARLNARSIRNGGGDVALGRNKFNMLNIVIEKA